MSASTLAQLAPVSPVLSSLAIGAAQSMAGLVFPRLPQVRVAPTASRGTIFVEASSGMLGSVQVATTALGADYPRRSLGAPTTVAYACDELKIASEIIPRKLSQRSQFPVALEEREAAAIGRKLALDIEARAAALMFGTGNWPDDTLANITGAGAQWGTIATATPLIDMQLAKVLVRESAYGRDADTVILGRQCADAFARSLHSSGVRVVTSGAAAVTRVVANDQYLIDLVRGELGLTLIIGGARRQTSADGATATAGYIWGKSMWVGCLEGADAVANESGDIMARATGALMVIEDGLSGEGVSMDGIALPMTVRSVETMPPQAVGTIVAAEAYVDEVVLDSNMGYLVTAVVA